MAVRSLCVIAGKYHLERAYCTPMRCLALLLHVATCQHHSLGPGRGTWSVGIPEDFGMDSELLSRAAAEVGRVGAERYCLLIAKDGVIVSETYYKNTSESTYESDSLGKTITASLLGVAVQHGLLDLDTPLVQYGVRPRGNWSVSGTDYFPEVTMRHLLTQSSGYGSPMRKRISRHPSAVSLIAVPSSRRAARPSDLSSYSMRSTTAPR